MRRAIRLILVTLGGMLLLVLAAVLFLESAWMRSWLETQASQRLGGREVEIGDHDIGWGWPLSVRFDDLRIANAEWAGEEDMARADRLVITADPGKWLKGEFELDHVLVDRPELYLVRDEEGTGNWAELTDDAQDQDASQDPGDTLGWLKAFTIERGRLAYRDMAQDVEFETALEAQATRTESVADDEPQARQDGDREGPAWERQLVETLAALDGYEGELSLSSERLGYADQSLHDIALDARLVEGRLDVERLQLVQASEDDQAGELNATGRVEVQEQRLIAEIDAEFDQVDLSQALAPLGYGELGSLDGRLVTEIVDGGLVFDDTVLDYRAPHWGIALSLNADSQEIEGSDKTGVHLVGDGTYQEEPFAFDLVVGPLLDLTDDETPYPVSGELSAGETRLRLDGSVVQPLQLVAVEGNFEIEGPNPAELSELTGLNLPELPPYRVRSYLSYRDDLLNLEDMQGGFGDSDVAGDVRLRLGEQPKIWATLTSDSLDADDLLPMLGIAPETDEGDAASAEQQQWREEEEQREEIFPDREWDLEGLRGTDIVLDYRANSVQARYVPFNDVSLEMVLEGGVMKVDPLQVGLGGGEVSASWNMDARQDPLDGDLAVSLEQVNIKDLLRSTEIPEAAENSLGTIGGRGNFQYRGHSMQEVMAGLDGTLELAMAQGWLDIITAELMPLNVANALVVALTGEDEQVRLECTYLNFEAEDGIATLEQFFMATEGAHFTAAGAINLENEVMELAFEGHNKEFTIFSANSPVKLEGPLRDLEVDVISRELLARGLASLLGAIIAPPTAILPWVDPGGGEEKGMGCEQAMREYREE